jgi:hypothetical protein
VNVAFFRLVLGTFSAGFTIKFCKLTVHPLSQTTQKDLTYEFQIQVIVLLFNSISLQEYTHPPPQ